MRAIRSLTLLLALIAPAAFADSQYQVEMFLLRQNAVPAITSQFAPEDWRQGAKAPSDYDVRKPVLTEQAEKLAADSNYTVLLHKAWQQQVGSEPSRVAISEGQEQFGHFPIEGNVSLRQGRFIEVQANFWVNQLDGNGSVIQSEQLRQVNSTVKNNELTFLDGGHLAVLFKVIAAGTRTTSPAEAEMMEQ